MRLTIQAGHVVISGKPSEEEKINNVCLALCREFDQGEGKHGGMCLVEAQGPNQGGFFSDADTDCIFTLAYNPKYHIISDIRDAYKEYKAKFK